MEADEVKPELRPEMVEFRTADAILGGAENVAAQTALEN